MRAMLDAAAGPRMHHGWILSGPKGIGKASFARAIALRLLADAAGPAVESGIDVPGSHPIVHLFHAGTHPDYVALERLEKDNGDLARNISVDQVRGLQRLLGNAPSLSHRRLVLIDSADDLERSAANALLKNLEEPPAGTTFLLVSHAPGRLLPTIRSRCRQLRFQALDDAALQVALRRALPDSDSDEIEALARAGEGSPGRALSFAGLELGDIEKTLAAIAATGDPSNAARVALAKKLSGKAARARYEAFLERAPAIMASAARNRSGSALREALAGWEQARQLAGGAIILSLDPASVVFELCGYIANLATARNVA